MVDFLDLNGRSMVNPMVNLWYFWIWWIFTGKILWLVNVAYSFLSDTLLIFALNITVVTQRQDVCVQ